MELLCFFLWHHPSSPRRRVQPRRSKDRCTIIDFIITTLNHGGTLTLCDPSAAVNTHFIVQRITWKGTARCSVQYWPPDGGGWSHRRFPGGEAADERTGPPASAPELLGGRCGWCRRRCARRCPKPGHQQEKQQHKNKYCTTVLFFCKWCWR